jgi:pre-mRNA-splicing factor SYF2
MPASKKRKTKNDSSVATKEADETSAQPQHDKKPSPPAVEMPPQAAPEATKAPSPSPASTTEQNSPTQPPARSTAASDRLARFQALKARAKASADDNYKQATLEAQRRNQDPAQLASLQRRHDQAAYKLLKADIEETGQDFERKRAWDWTVEESEAWDRRTRKKAAARDGNLFQDHRSESNKVYKRQLGNLAVDHDAYEKEKMAAIERAAASGGLDIIETEEGELIAVDKNGSFYSTSDSRGFAENKPDKAAVDRLVEDLKRAEEQRLKKRRERMAKNGDDGDVTYINEKNKQFNQKLARFYDKYTQDLRDSFERGTNI